MKYLITVLVGTAAITAAVTTAIAQAHRAFNGDVSLTPYLYAYGVAAVLLLVAFVMGINASKQEQQALPPPTVHQENKQTVNQEFHFGVTGHVPVAVERDETAINIRAFMKRAHPHSSYTAEEIATEFNLSKSRAWSELEKQQAEGWVLRKVTDQGTLWIFYDKEL